MYDPAETTEEDKANGEAGDLEQAENKMDTSAVEEEEEEEEKKEEVLEIYMQIYVYWFAFWDLCILYYFYHTYLFLNRFMLQCLCLSAYQFRIILFIP